MAKNINTKPFDETTQLKLDIFRECFREWLPVFIHDYWTEGVYIFDFFAGSGTDSIGKLGSPLILLDEAKGTDRHFCGNSRKDVSFVFNESMRTKSKELEGNINKHINKCEQTNKCGGCVYNYQVTQLQFKSMFKEPKVVDILKNKKIGKFILLDQYGFKEIGDEIFKSLVAFPKTDFIFFISSSFIRRFQQHPNVKAYIDTGKLNFDESQPKECHRIIADYFKNSIPKNIKEYYLHHFSIQKETGKGNYYGLIFGSNHTLGMEKFLKVCWSKDSNSGEANFNIENDFEEGSLFYNPDTSNKKEQVKRMIKDNILNGRINDNITGMKYTLSQGCEPSLFVQVVKELEKDRKIERIGQVNNSTTNIHRIKSYDIKVKI